MFREIITAQSDKHTVHIPKEYINTKVEILVLPFVDQEEEKVDTKSTSELLKRFREVINTKSKDSIKIDDDTILNPHEALSDDIS